MESSAKVYRPTVQAGYATVSHNVFPAIPAVLGLNVCFLIYSAIMLLLFRSEFKDESDPA